MKNSILNIKNLSKTYHDINSSTIAVDNICFNVNNNEILVIVGPSGCGKSTILSILAGIEKKSSGNIIFDNNERTFSYMLQKDSLFPWLNILDNCLLGLKINKTLTDENKKYVINLLEKYGLKDFIYKFPKNLSGGMRQRVALIRTLATKPDILLLDEALSSLDYQSKLHINDDIYKIIKNEEKSAIIVTHDIEEAISIADRIIVLSKRPAKVKSTYNINLINKTIPSENRNCPNFNDYYSKIWGDLNAA